MLVLTLSRCILDFSLSTNRLRLQTFQKWHFSFLTQAQILANKQSLLNLSGPLFQLSLWEIIFQQYRICIIVIAFFISKSYFQIQLNICIHPGIIRNFNLVRITFEFLHKLSLSMALISTPISRNSFALFLSHVHLMIDMLVLRLLCDSICY